MAILSEKYKLAYFPIHKVANTSLKLTMYQIEHGKPFAERANKKRVETTIHKNFPKTAAYSAAEMASLGDYWRFAVVRDPVKRVIACYTNRMNKWSRVFDKALNNAKRRDELLADGIEANPTPDAFFLNLAAYRRHFLRVRHHTDLSFSFLGPDLAAFDRVYPIEAIDQLQVDLSEKTGLDVQIPKANSSKSSSLEFSEDARKALIEYARPDYEFLADFYSQPMPTTDSLSV